MSLGSWVKIMGFATFTALIYIHMQTQIVDLAYKGKSKEKKVHELMDNNGALTHQILALKSANHLGQKLLEKDEGLQFMGHDRVMTLTGPAIKPVAMPVQEKTKPEAPFAHLLSFFSPREAKAWDH